MSDRIGVPGGSPRSAWTPAARPGAAAPASGMPGEPATLRVAYLVEQFPRLSETFVLDEIRGHARNGLEVTVLSLYRAPDEELSAARLSRRAMPARVINVFRFRSGMRRYAEKLLRSALGLATSPRSWRVLFEPGFGTLGDRANIVALAGAVRQNPGLRSLDLFHCHFGQNGRYGVALRRLGSIGGPVLTTFHGNDVSVAIRRHGPRHYEQLFRHGDLFLPISRHWADRLVELGCDPARICVHRMGIDCLVNAFRPRSLLPGEPARLISVGRLIEKKGQIHLLRALAELRTRRPELAFTLDLVGDGPDAALLRAEASRLTLDPCVRFHGSLPHGQVLALLESASIFVLPSVTASDGDMEGIPVALMEAMAQGLPVISTRHSGIPELVEEDVSGLLVPERDPLALSRAIETLLAAPETWPLYGAAGRRRVEAAFERKELDRTLRELYVRILPGRHAVAQAEG